VFGRFFLDVFHLFVDFDSSQRVFSLFVPPFGEVRANDRAPGRTTKQNRDVHSRLEAAYACSPDHTGMQRALVGASNSLPSVGSRRCAIQPLPRMGWTVQGTGNCWGYSPRDHAL